MAVFQPSAVLGNSRALVTLGPHGEVMSFFYPHIDFAQNLREGMPAVFFPDETGGGVLSWVFDPPWQACQRYLDRTNCVETLLYHPEARLRLRVTDLVLPDQPVLVRRFEVTQEGDALRRARLFQYLSFQMGETLQKNAVHFHPEEGLGIAYWRDISLAIAGEKVDDFGCGRSETLTSTKHQLTEGRLNRQEDEIGNVDMAVGWSMALGPGETACRHLWIAAGGGEEAAAAQLRDAQVGGWEGALTRTGGRWQEHLARAREPDIEPDLKEAYYRCLLALDLLVDSETGAILAAPEFDPDFERSGGYGYCWPRDAVEVCLGLEAAGYPEYTERFLSWAERCQAREGHWEQRYWLSGERAPSWCTHDGQLQIDQTASVLFAMGRQATRLTGTPRARFLETNWEAIRRAAANLIQSLSPAGGLHRPAFDLWETFRGSFTYSNAAISAALRQASYAARMVGRDDFASDWQARSEVTRQAVLTRLWQGAGFVRGTDAEGRLDTTADASVLGLITPFEFLELQEPEQYQRAVALVESLVRRIGRHRDGAETLLRFEGDRYADGGPGAVATLWLARAFLSLGLSPLTDREHAQRYRGRAVASLRAVLASGTPTGLLPEAMGAWQGGYWAAPHAWATAAFVGAAVQLSRLRA